MTERVVAPGSLFVVGTGIKTISHLTVEAKAHIEQADLVLYLVNEPVMQEWIMHANPNTQSLDKAYFSHASRQQGYAAITDYILQYLRQGIYLCVVLYGHPTVYANPALAAVKQAQQEGYTASILPAISAADCLFADLQIDPGQYGCLSYEATDLLIHKRSLDDACHLLIWQASAIGALGHLSQHDNTLGQQCLTDYLLAHYNPKHEIIVYIAAQYPSFEPEINKLSVADLPKAKIASIATLYVPPASVAERDEGLVQALGLERLLQAVS